MTSTVLSRRQVLRGAMGGAALSVGLPPLEAVLDTHGTAFADGTPIPKRFGTWFWGQGVKADRWVPSASGSAWKASPSPSLKPLGDRKLLDYVSVVSRSWVPFKVYGPPHPLNYDMIVTSAPLNILSGPNSDGNYRAERGGPSALDVIKQFLAGRTRYDAFENSISRGHHVAGSLANIPADPSWDPRVFYDKMFAAVVAGPAAQAPSQATLDARKSVLDAVAADAEDVRRRLGGSDRRRLDEHLASVRALERSVTFAGGPSCAALARPANRPPDDGTREALEPINLAFAELYAYGLACDLTRFFRMTFNRPQSNTFFWQVDVPRDYHEFGHSEPGAQPGVQRCVEFIMKQLAVFLDKLRGVPIGAGNLLDHCCVWAFSEINDPQIHGLYDVPNLMIGKCGGKLRGGIHYDGAGQLPKSSGDAAARTAVPDALHSRLILTMMQALGMPQERWGLGEAASQRPIAELAL